MPVSVELQTRYPKVCIIIVNYNGTSDTVHCIESLKKQHYPNVEIVVVDNCSNEVSKLESYLEESNVRFLKLASNRGFAAGNNAGVRFANAHYNDIDYFLMLNNDTVVDSDFITPLVNEIDFDEKIGACCSHINYFENPCHTWYGGGHINWKTGSSVHETKAKEIGEPKDVDFLTGCAMLFPAKLINEIGYLNEDYFLFYEDAEYSVKIKRAGYRLRYVPTSLVLHKVSSTAGLKSPLSNYYGTRNKMYFMSLYSSKLDFTIFLIYFTAKVFIKQLMYLLKGQNFKSIRKAVQNGYRDYFQKKTGKQEFHT